MRLTVFASGSTGNCSLVSGAGAHILVDAGISAKRITAGLASVGLAPTSLDGIFITHEHSDHIKGLAVLMKHGPVPVFAPGAVAEYLRRALPGVLPFLHTLTPPEPVELGEMRVIPFPTPHDVRQSVGYRVEAEDTALFFATDTGCVTEEMLCRLAGADAALMEANHDVDMLRHGPYPPELQQRILSDRGHLSNAECTWLAAVAAHQGTRHIVLGHMSRENNTPELALRTVRRGLEGTDAVLYAAPELGCLSVEVSPCFV